MGENDVLGSLSGYFGADIYTDGDPTRLRFEFMGAESHYRTVFKVKGANGEKGKMVHRPNQAGSYVMGNEFYHYQPIEMDFASDSLIDFTFRAVKKFEGETYKKKVKNGANPLMEHLGFHHPDFASYWVGLETSGDNISAIYLALNHGLPSLPDFDDLVIKITTVDPAPVPLPASYAFFMLALSSLGLFKRASVQC